MPSFRPSAALLACGKQWHTLSYFAGCQPVASRRRVTRKPASEEGDAGGVYDACLSGTAVAGSFGAFSSGALGGATAAFGSAAGRCRVSGQGRFVPLAPSERDAAGATGASDPQPFGVNAGAMLPANGDVGAGAPDMGTGAILGDGPALGAQLEHPAPESVPEPPHAPA